MPSVLPPELACERCAVAMIAERTAFQIDWHFVRSGVWLTNIDM